MIDKKIVVNKGYLKNLLTFNQTELFEHIVRKVSKNNNYNMTVLHKNGIIVICPCRFSRQHHPLLWLQLSSIQIT